MSLALNLVLGTIVGVSAILKAIHWGVGLEPKGKHAARRSVRVKADLFEETVPVAQTESQPPPEFFADDPEWVEAARNWNVGRSSIRVLTEELMDDAWRCRQIRKELRAMYDAA